MPSSISGVPQLLSQQVLIILKFSKRYFKGNEKDFLHCYALVLLFGLPTVNDEKKKGVSTTTQLASNKAVRRSEECGFSGNQSAEATPTMLGYISRDYKRIIIRVNLEYITCANRTSNLFYVHWNMLHSTSEAWDLLQDFGLFLGHGHQQPGKGLRDYPKSGASPLVTSFT